MAKNEQRIVTKGNRYRNKDTGETVVVFFVDHLGSAVRYSPEGPASGREYGMSIDAFLAAFEDAPVDAK